MSPRYYVLIAGYAAAWGFCVWALTQSGWHTAIAAALTAIFAAAVSDPRGRRR